MTSTSVILRISRLAHLDADDLLTMPINDSLQIITDRSRMVNASRSAQASWLFYVRRSED